MDEDCMDDGADVVRGGSDGATGGVQTLINGAGATFPYPIYSKWLDEYTKVDPEVRFNYQSLAKYRGREV
jgi:ABC-type phosphate transport system substrate-binding protein